MKLQYLSSKANEPSFFAHSHMQGPPQTGYAQHVPHIGAIQCKKCNHISFVLEMSIPVLAFPILQFLRPENFAHGYNFPSVSTPTTLRPAPQLNRKKLGDIFPEVIWLYQRS